VEHSDISRRSRAGREDFKSTVRVRFVCCADS
jgi:hypothetical protein